MPAPVEARGRAFHEPSGSKSRTLRNRKAVAGRLQVVSGAMPLTVPLGDVTHVIQLAIAPVFLLTAIGTFLNVLAGRLARTIDRRRNLASIIGKLDAGLAAEADAELAYVQRRVRIIYIAILLAVAAALLICLLIAIAFLDALIAANLSQLVAILFMLAMLALIGSLGCFMREVYLGVSTAGVPIR